MAALHTFMGPCTTNPLTLMQEAAAAAERAKREAWMVEQTRAIKEATVRGLEPEIQRLVDSHKAELKRAEHRCVGFERLRFERQLR